MEAVREALAVFGNAWNGDVASTLMKLFEPLQAKQNTKYAGRIKTEKAIKYGTDARNRIDVYTPAEADTSGSTGKPVVVFFHGGGLVGGDNDATPNVYANLGNYFTSNGCITCLATYRLALQGGHFPNGAEDIAASLKWVRANISRYGGDPDKVVALGQSAGAHHLATSMFLGMLDPNPEPLLRGAVLLSAPFTVGTQDPSRSTVFKDWLKTNNLFEINGRWSPTAIFRQQYFGTTTTAPHERLPCELLMMIGEYEIDEVLEGTWEFVGDYKKRFGKLPILEVLKGHNHVSYCFGLGLDDPDYERVGTRLLEYVKVCTA